MSAQLEIRAIDFNPPGWDVVEADEHVLIVNAGDSDATLTGWTLRDDRVHRRHSFIYRFPDGFVLRAGQSVRVWSGRGTDDFANLHWGRESAVWNNDGDSALLADDAGRPVSRYTYPPPPPPLGVLAWNCAEGIGLGDESTSLAALAAEIAAAGPDLVLLSEVCLNWHGHFNQAQVIGQAAGYPFVEQAMTSHRFISREEKRVAVLSRTPLEWVERIEHSAYFGGGGYATLHVRTDVRGRTHHVFSTRITAYDTDEQVHSYAQLAERIGALGRDAAVILGGDFNSGYQRYDAESLPVLHSVPPPYAAFARGTRLQNVLGGLGWETFSPDDQLLFRGPYRAQAARRVAPAANPSDHPYVAALLAPVGDFQHLALDDGRLLHEPASGRRAVVFGGARFAVPDDATQARLYGALGEPEDVAPGVLDGLPALPIDGSVLREENGTRAAWVGGGVLHWVAGDDVLVRHGGTDAVRRVPDGALAALPLGDDDVEVPPTGWADFWHWNGGGATLEPASSKNDRIDYAVEEDATGVPANQLEFVLAINPALGWDKELVIVTADGQGLERQTTLHIKPRGAPVLARIALKDRATTHLKLRKDRFVSGLLDVSDLRGLEHLPAGSRVTFTWRAD